jgi:gentisate 1,2-dioxygenase
MIAEIPAGWHTGRHAHGEEGIFIVEGEGFTVLRLSGEEGPGSSFRWSKGSTLHIPFGAEHQHFNTGNTPVRYFSLMALSLEHWLGFAKIDQLEECGETRKLPSVPSNESRLDSQGRRIVLLWENIAWREWTDKIRRHTRVGPLMRRGQGFENLEVSITDVFFREPGEASGSKHSHMEAFLYILQGEGYTVVDGERVDWKKGACLHIPGPQTVHEHFVTGKEPYMMLRCDAGVRSKFAQNFAMERFPYQWFTPEGGLMKENRSAKSLHDWYRKHGTPREDSE